MARLPVTGSDLFGREEVIAFLDRAWANKDVNVVTIAAWAGVGKSTLVNHWLRGMATDRYRSAELIFTLFTDDPYPADGLRTLIENRKAWLELVMYGEPTTALHDRSS
jgi:hypothetical protein